jgi:hypothetical protein
MQLALQTKVSQVGDGVFATGHLQISGWYHTRLYVVPQRTMNDTMSIDKVLTTP